MGVGVQVPLRARDGPGSETVRGLFHCTRLVVFISATSPVIAARIPGIRAAIATKLCWRAIRVKPIVIPTTATITLPHVPTRTAVDSARVRRVNASVVADSLARCASRSAAAVPGTSSSYSRSIEAGGKGPLNWVLIAVRLSSVSRRSTDRVFRITKAAFGVARFRRASPAASSDSRSYRGIFRDVNPSELFWSSRSCRNFIPFPG